jgi:thiosulfate/3-mercaptopyruvate sulfurtransferase
MALIALLMLANVAFGGEAYCNACNGDSGWSGTAKLDEEDNSTIVRSEMAKRMLVSIDEAGGSAIYLDISEQATEHIPGSIAISYDKFLNGTDLRGEAELDVLLGDAGISRNDSVIIYGECMPCGGGPAPATFVYWIMRSLGHENVRVLDGTINDWVSSGRSAVSDTVTLPAKTYVSQITSDFAANYDYVNSGRAQIVDARTVQEFGNSSIPGAINMPYESVLLNDRLLDESKLKQVFAILNEGQPVVAYTNTGIKASVVWFALTMLGYDAKLYSYENYWINQELLRLAGETNETA